MKNKSTHEPQQLQLVMDVSVSNAPPAEVSSLPVLSIPEVVKEVQLPPMRFDVLEQFGLALQNRDAKALEFLVSDQLESLELKNKAKFIHNYISYCDKLEKKHGSIYVQVVKGACDAKTCNYRCPGLAVSIHKVTCNKQVWNFNLVTDEDGMSKLDLHPCRNFKVNTSDV